jgi:hypothetical protein
MAKEGIVIRREQSLSTIDGPDSDDSVEFRVCLMALA